MPKSINRNLRILMLTEFFYPFDRGGSEWSVYNLAKALIKKNIQVEIFTPNYGGKSRDIYNGINIYRFPFYLKLSTLQQTLTPLLLNNPLWFIVNFICLSHRIIKFKPDIIHIQGKYFLPAAVILGKIFEIRTIITLRDYIILCPYSLCLNQKNKYKSCSIVNVLFKDFPQYYLEYVKNKNIFQYFLNILYAIYGYTTSLILKFFLNLCDVKVAISKKEAFIYRSNNIKIDKIIYNSIEFNNIFKENNKPKNQIVFVGRLTRGKGIDQLILAYKLFKQSYKGFLPQLIIIGSKNQNASLLNDSFIRFTGHLTHKKTLQIISQSKLLIIPSIWEEPFGRSALEALYSNTPVVASNKGALPEIIKNYRYGRCVEPNPINISRAILYILKSWKKIRKFIHQDRKIINQKFSVLPVKQYIHLYEEITK